MIMNLFPTIGRWVRRTTNEADNPRVLDARRFRGALERERMRADRTQGLFSVIEFRCPPDERALLVRLIEILERRLRATDDLGRLPEGLGVLLPETPRQNAQQLAESISEALTAGDSLQWIVRAYPDEETLAVTAETDSAQVAAPNTSAVAQPATDSVVTSPAQFLFLKPLPLWKRSVDVLVSGCALLLAMPILLLAAAAIKLNSPGPVLFYQRRTGLGGKPFTMVKLRTMYVDAEARKDALRHLSEQDGPAFKMKDDPRITTVGKYLRKTCIDELPQLWNVLIGDMTLVGPRPLPCNEAEGCQNWERRRLDVTPGLTCIWQVRSGRSRIAFADWMRMDLQYIRRRSPLEDLKLLWKTFVAVILHRASH